MEGDKKFGLFIPAKKQNVLVSKGLFNKDATSRTSTVSHEATVDVAVKSVEEDLADLDYEEIMEQNSFLVSGETKSNKDKAKRARVDLESTITGEPKQSKHMHSLLESAARRERDREYYINRRIEREASENCSTVFVSSSYRKQKEQVKKQKEEELHHSKTSSGIQMMKNNIRLLRR